MNMEIIGIAIAQLLFIGGAIAFVIWLMAKLGNKDKIPGV